MKTLLITANSPGEIAGWMRPVLARWRAACPGAGVVVILLPCTFASGRESDVAHALEGVERVVPAARFPHFLSRGGADYRGCPLLHLGGDLMYAAALSWRWGLAAWSYLWARPWWDGAFCGYFTRDGSGVQWLLRRRVDPGKILVVGDLVVDSVEQRCRHRVQPEPGTVSFLPGSRHREVEGLVPFYLGVAEALACPGRRFQLLLSPFVDPRRQQELLTASPHVKVGGAKGHIEGNELVSPAGVRVSLHRQDGLEALARSELAITIPGTKTAEAGCLGVPCLTLLPLNRPEELPFIGLLGLLDWLPGGGHLKGRYLVTLKESIGLVAQPNILAGRALMPELIDVLSPSGVAEAAARLLEQPSRLAEVSLELRRLYSPLRGASARIVAAIRSQTLSCTH